MRANQDPDETGYEKPAEIIKKEKRVRVAFVIALVFVVAGFVPVVHGFITTLSWNEFGDYIGGSSGALWALAGLLVIYMAFTSQQIEIVLQREELKLQRLELKDTREVLSGQSKIMAAQQNDNTFFNLLQNHRELVESFKGGGSNNSTSGYEVMNNIRQSWTSCFEIYTKIYRTGIILDDRVTGDSPEMMVARHPNVSTHYSEVVHLVDFVRTRFEKGENQDFYLRSLWTSLTEAELFILDTFDQHFGEGDLVPQDLQTYFSFDYERFSNWVYPAAISVGAWHKILDRSSESALRISTEASIVDVNLIVHELDYEIAVGPRYRKVRLIQHAASFESEYRYDIHDALLNCYLNIFPAVNAGIGDKLYRNRFSVEVNYQQDSTSYKVLVNIRFGIRDFDGNEFLEIDRFQKFRESDLKKFEKLGIL